MNGWRLSPSSWLNGFSQCSFDTPAEFQATVDGVCVDAGNLGPFDETPCLSVVRDLSVMAAVSALNGRSGPSTIVRRVWTVIVDAIERHAQWAWSHIGPECVERVAPSITDAYASCPVRLKPFVFGISAPILHVCPDSIFIPGADSALLSFATTVRGTTGEVSRQYIAESAASTSTFPKDVAVRVLVWQRSYCGEQTECHAGQITGTWIKYSGFSHAGSSDTGTVLVRGRWSLSTVICPAFNYPTSSAVWA